MVIDDYNNSNPNPKITITAPAPKVRCAKCGKEFTIRGKRDEYAINGGGVVYCTDCEREMAAKLFGGPLDGQSAY